MNNKITKKLENITKQDLENIKNKKKCYDGPITGNVKCIIISVFLALFYWYIPPKNKYVLLGILYITYILIAYYDFFYDCRKGEFGPTFLKTYYEWSKPKNSKQSIIYSNLCSNKKNLIMIVDIIVFILLIIFTPIFLRWKPKK